MPGPGAGGDGLDDVAAAPDPPSQMISIRSPTASATGATRSKTAGALSSWRPPWFESAMAVDACVGGQDRASSTVWMPLITSGPSQMERSQSTSSPRETRGRTAS